MFIVNWSLHYIYLWLLPLSITYIIIKWSKFYNAPFIWPKCAGICQWPELTIADHYSVSGIFRDGRSVSMKEKPASGKVTDAVAVGTKNQ